MSIDSSHLEKTYYTLQKIRLLSNKSGNEKMILNGTIYGNNKDEIRQLIKDTKDDLLYGIMYETKVKLIDVNQNSSLKDKIEYGQIDGLASDVNAILAKWEPMKDEKTDQWDGKTYIKNKNKKKLIEITQIMDFIDTTNNTIKNPIFIKYQKNGKKYVYEPDKITDKIENTTEFYKNLDNNYRKNVETMNTNVAEGNKQFGIYLLEEKIKDTFKGLGSEIQRVKYESLDKQFTQSKNEQLQRGISILESKIIEALKNSNSNTTIDTQTEFQPNLTDVGIDTVQQNVFESMGLNPLEPENELYKGLFNRLII